MDIISIILAVVIVTIQGPDFNMVVESDCAAVINASGYTEASDIHKYVTGTPSYIEACF